MNPQKELLWSLWVFMSCDCRIELRVALAWDLTLMIMTLRPISVATHWCLCRQPQVFGDLDNLRQP